MAVVVLRAGQSATVDELIAYCRERMAGYKAPKRVEVIEQLPKNARSEEHTSELQSLMRISYAVFCLKKNKITKHNKHTQLLPHKALQCAMIYHEVCRQN